MSAEHFGWCDPPRCTIPDPDGFPRAGVHRSREIAVRVHGRPLGVWLFATERGDGTPHLIVGGVAISWSEVVRVVAEIESLMAPRREVDSGNNGV